MATVLEFLADDGHISRIEETVHVSPQQQSVAGLRQSPFAVGSDARLARLLIIVDVGYEQEGNRQANQYRLDKSRRRAEEIGPGKDGAARFLFQLKSCIPCDASPACAAVWFPQKERLQQVELGTPMSYNQDMSPPDLTLIREFKRRAQTALPGRVVRVLLYGSRARGDARPDSDWDVAILLRGPPTPQDRRTLSDIGFDLMLESGQHLQPIAIDASRSLDDSSFLKNLHEDGIAA